jgi:hypothetical protein
MLDQQIALARAVAEQRAHIIDRLRIKLAAFGGAAGFAAARFRAIAANARRVLNIHYCLRRPRIERIQGAEQSPRVDRMIENSY